MVIGAGVNELVAAHLLSRSGRRVLVLDPRPGSQKSLESGWVPPRVVSDLALDARNLKIHRPDPWAEAPLPQGGRLQLWQDMSRSVEALRKISPRDAQHWPAFCERMRRLARLLEEIYAKAPPDPVSGRLRDIAQLAALGWRARRLGRQGLEALLRLLPMSAADFLDDWFENDALKGVLGALAVMHQCHGPRSGGTAFLLLHHHAGSPAGVFSPPLSNLRSVLEKAPGLEIRRAIEVARITVREGSVTGVALASGEEIATALVVSGLDPRRTLLSLADPGWLDPEVARAVRHIRARGVVARVNVTTEAAPGFTSLVVAPSLDYVERAYDDAKYGRISREPRLLASSSPAMEGPLHRVDIHVQYAPYALRDGAWDERTREALGRKALDILSQHAPALGAARIESVLSPRDLEQSEGWPEGQAYHAELALDQVLWMRPIPQLARYRTPVKGLYLCGPSMHPGAGIAGAAGFNCAREIMSAGHNA